MVFAEHRNLRPPEGPGAGRASGQGDEHRPPARPLSLRAKVLLALLVLSLLLAGLLSYQNLRLLRARSAAVDHTLRVLMAGQSLSTAILGAETGERGYLLTGNAAMLEAYQRGSQAYLERFALLKALTRDNPLQQARLAALGPLVDARMHDLAASVEAYARGNPAAIRAAVAREGPAALEDIRARILEVQSTERGLLDERTGEADAAYRLGIALTLASALFLVLLLGLFVASGRRDLRTLQQLERSVAEKETRLRIALDSARMGIHVWDIGSGRIEWDARVRELWAIGRDEAVDFGTFLAGLHPEDRYATQAAIRAALDPDREGMFSAEYRVIGRDDGVLRWVHATGRVYFDERRPVQLIGTVREITGSKFAELALRDADRRKDEFLATLAHELRNPLAPIRSAATLLRDVGEERRQWATRIIDRQVQTMSRLLDDLLDVARITRGKLVLQRRRVSLASVIEGALETARPLIDARGHAVGVALSPGIELDADPVRLEQVFANLLTNAAKYMDRGGRIEVRGEAAGGTVSVSVIDRGIGIEPDVLPRLFEIFSQGDTALHVDEAGLGIGLALVKATVELHGGSVEARSAGTGCGSEFIVRLPLAAVRSPAGMQLDAPHPVATARRILVVDDNRDGAETLALVLEAGGHEVDVACSGREALAAASRGLPDTAIVDIAMPDVSGYDVGRAIRALPGGSAVQLIALTGRGQERDREQAFQAGFDAHLTKPVDPRALARLLARVSGERWQTSHPVTGP